MIELERTYLANQLPDLTNCTSKEVIDVYILGSIHRPKLRLGKDGDRYELTKKTPIDCDNSEMNERSIDLDEQEFNEQNKLEGKIVSKIR